MRSAHASWPATGNSARSGARTPRRLPRPGRGCRPRHAGSVAGCWRRPPTRPSSARSWSRSSGARSRCRRRSRSCSRVPRSVLKSTRTDARCAGCSSRGNDVDQLSQLPPIVWVLIAAAVAFGFVLSLAWRWYRRYRARKALHNAVIAGTMDHLVDALVPDGMGGGYHVDYLLLTQRGVVVIDLRDVRGNIRSEEHTSELQSRLHLVCRLLLEKKTNLICVNSSRPFV